MGGGMTLIERDNYRSLDYVLRDKYGNEMPINEDEIDSTIEVLEEAKEDDER